MSDSRSRVVSSNSKTRASMRSVDKGGTVLALPCVILARAGEENGTPKDFHLSSNHIRGLSSLRALDGLFISRHCGWAHFNVQVQ